MYYSLILVCVITYYTHLLLGVGIVSYIIYQKMYNIISSFLRDIPKVEVIV